jgi:hypothetical protein
MPATLTMSVVEVAEKEEKTIFFPNRRENYLTCETLKENMQREIEAII